MEKGASAPPIIMTKTLYAKLVLALLALLSVIAVLYLILTYYSTGMYLKEVNQRLHKDLSKNLVSENILMIEVRVEDTGAGIPAKDLHHIFDRFYRVNKSRADDGAESGLGLAIAKRILELHESAIEVESTPGAGTAFSFHLPRITP